MTTKHNKYYKRTGTSEIRHFHVVHDIRIPEKFVDLAINKKKTGALTIFLALTGVNLKTKHSYILVQSDKDRNTYFLAPIKGKKINHYEFWVIKDVVFFNCRASPVIPL